MGFRMTPSSMPSAAALLALDHAVRQLHHSPARPPPRRPSTNLPDARQPPRHAHLPSKICRSQASRDRRERLREPSLQDLPVTGQQR
uniref:Uncharacterized protein n=1 Tax=Setaria viridis TaxID=4556 RepID=A0A4U6UJN1_SETVI|nr:hypothetical protein SEVIR_5G303900v2 [Setaria viridis]